MRWLMTGARICCVSDNAELEIIDRAMATGYDLFWMDALEFGDDSLDV